MSEVEVEKNSEENYEWLTEELFEPIIAKELSDCARSDYSLKLVSVKPAVGKGDNYISLVTRVVLEVRFNDKIDRQPKNYYFIVKSSINLVKEMADLNVFDKEISFYEEIGEQFRKLDDTITFMPKFYAAKLPDRQVIIMNDLTADGFKMQDRHTGLDLEHCRLFYKTIAQFHALSAVCYEKFGRFHDRFHKSVYRIEYKAMNDQWSEILYTEFLRIFDRYESLKPYREVFHKWKKGVFEAICNITLEKPEEFNVLNHGDGWVNNMMFNHDANNKPTELCLVDFQISVYGTPMTDILYFFATSPTLEVRANHFDELLHTYHTSLVEHLTKYDYPKPIPTMRDLQMMVCKHGLLGPYFLYGVGPIVLLDSDKSRSFEYFVKEDEEGKTFRYNLYNTPRLIKTLEVALKFFERRGLLDF